MKFILLRFVFIVSMGLASLPVFSQDPPPPNPPADDDITELPLHNSIWVLGGLAIVYAFYTNKKIGNIDS